MNASEPRSSPPLLTLPRLVLFLCLLAFAIYLHHSGQGQAMARSLCAELQLTKAMEKLSVGNSAQAFERLEAAAKASEAHSMQLRVGMVYSLAGLHPRALPHLLLAVNSNPNDPDALYHLGNSLLKTARLPEADTAFQSALAVRPNDPVLLNNIGYSYADEGIRLEDAEELILTAVAIRPREGFILDSLGWVYFKQGRLPEAISYLEKAHKISPNNPEIAAHLIQVRAKAYSAEETPLAH